MKQQTVALVGLVALVALCAPHAAQARQLKQQPAATFAEALQAAAGTRVSTLVSAVQAAGITVPADASWTIFTPTNEAWGDDIREPTGLTAAQLLEPANRQALVQVLSYHVVPSAAVRAAQLTDGQQLTTLLEGAAPLRVDIDDDGVEIEVPTAGDDDDGADVVAADIVAGGSIVHVIDEVLIPPSLRRNATGTVTVGPSGDDDDDNRRRLLDDDHDHDCHRHGGDDGDDDCDGHADHDHHDDDDDDKKRKA